MRHNILHIIGVLEIGGAQKVAINLYKDFNELGHKNTLITLYNKNEFKNEKIDFLSLNENIGGLFSNIYKLFYRPYKIYKVCKKYDIDTIISHGEESNFVSIILGIFYKKVNVLPIIHGDITKNHKGNIIYCILINILYKKNKLICVSEELKYKISNYYKIKLNDIIVIKNYFGGEIINDLNSNIIINNDKVKLITVGRLVDLKNHIEMIDIFNKLNKEKYELYIIGEGEYRKNIEIHINKLGLNDCIHLLGEKQNPTSYIKKCDIFLLTSKWEGYPIVLIESIFAGVPIISYNTTTGPNEILNNTYIKEELNTYKISENGILVEYGNKDAFKNAIEFLYENKDIYLKIKNNIEKNKYLFSKDYILKIWDNIIQKKS